jgi:hypothetical protein
VSEPWEEQSRAYERSLEDPRVTRAREVARRLSEAMEKATAGFKALTEAFAKMRERDPEAFVNLRGQRWSKREP